MITAYQEIGTDVYELDRKTLCTELYEDKEVLVIGLLGEFIKMKVTAEHDAESENLWAIIQHWESLDTVRRNYICTGLLDKRGIMRAKF